MRADEDRFACSYRPRGLRGFKGVDFRVDFVDYGGEGRSDAVVELGDGFATCGWD